MKTLTFSFSGGECRNPSLGLTTKARACKVAGQDGKLGSESKCEGSTLRVGVSVDSRMFKEQL